MSAPAPAIRPERPADGPAIRTLLVAAFGTPAEADLVDALRRDGELLVSLVATDGDAVVGHAAASPVSVSGVRDPVAAVAIAPVAVHPDRQRGGIGTLLMHALIAQLRDRGIGLALLLGDPYWYGRFGFAAATAARLRTPFDGPHQMALELAPGGADALAGGTVGYARAFAPFLPPQ